MSQHNEHTSGDEELFSQELGDWALFALDSAVEFYNAGASTPFLLVQDQNDQKQLVDIELTVQAEVDQLLHVARAKLPEMFPAAPLYALVWDAGLNIEGEEHNAIMAECGERGEPNAWLFAQLYQGEVLDGSFEPKDDPVIISAVKSAFEREEGNDR